eukprot:Skav226245  [mRNA]  locus=scaffold1218:576421:577713:- [translate_table: standard]
MLAKQEASRAVVPAGCEADALVGCNRSAPFVDISGLADERYAIAESILDTERENCPNWMQTQHTQFENEHGQWMQPSEEDCRAEDDDDQDGDPMSHCPNDLCAREAERLDDYHVWFEQCKEVLRIFRTLRKAKGFPPDHPLITVTRSDVGGVQNLHPGDVVYLFAKIAFSPFDATLVKLKLQPMGPDALRTWVAKMHPADDGLPDVISLDLFLKHCCESFDGEQDQIQLLTYCGGRRLGELDIESMEDIDHARERVAPAAPVDADLDEDQKNARKRMDLLRKAVDAGGEKQKQAKSKQPKTMGRPKAVKKPHLKKSQRGEVSTQNPEDPTENVDPDEPGQAGVVHALIEREWRGALEADLPPAAAPSAPSSASSSNMPAPSEPETEAASLSAPWKDPSGYCFLPRDGKLKGRYLGAQLSFCQSDECSVKV